MNNHYFPFQIFLLIVLALYLQKRILKFLKINRSLNKRTTQYRGELPYENKQNNPKHMASCHSNVYLY